MTSKSEQGRPAFNDVEYRENLLQTAWSECRQLDDVIE